MRITRPALLTLVIIGCCIVTGQAQKIGIVTDFKKTTVIDSIIQVMVEEINKTTGSAREVTLSSEDVIYQTNTLELAKSNYEKLEPSVDLMILIGSISTKGSYSIVSKTPTIGLGISDPYLQELPFTDGKSGTKNFSYIWSSVDFVKEIEEFRKISDFNNLAILVDPGSAITFNLVATNKSLDSLSQSLALTMNIVPVGDDMSQSLSALPPNTDAVYLTELYGKNQADIRFIADLLKEKDLPSFSSTKWHVDAGILGSLSDENGLDQLIRKLSVMADDAFAGEPLEDIPVKVTSREEYFLNLQTAQEINLSPPFEVIFTANLIGQNASKLPTYSLEEVMQKALEANFDIKISYKDIELTEQDIVSGRSALLPALDLSLSGVQINEERASPLLQSAERTITGQLSFTQLIYSEEAIAGLKILHHLNKAQEFDTESDILAVLLDTYVSYFNLLAAKTNLLIQQENLKNTKTNLELAKIRLELGSASRADLYRWESEVATARQSVVEAQTGVMSSKLQLNTFLANSLEEEFDIEDITIDDELFLEFQSGPLEEFIKTPDDFKLASDFLVLEATTNNPNKQFLLENIKAAEREKRQNRRLFYLPQVALQAQTDQIFDRSGAGSVETDGVEFFDNSWQVALSLNYSLFQGFNRKANLQRSNVQLEQLNYSRQQLDQNLELAVRTRTLSLLNTSTNINFSKTAADNARSNYELVRDNYQQGVVNITQLIDAQQAALNANLAYAISIYDYLQAYVQLEFAVGSYSKFATQEELNALRDRFIQFASDN